MYFCNILCFVVLQTLCSVMKNIFLTQVFPLYSYIFAMIVQLSSILIKYIIGFCISTPKTKAGIRSIPMPQPLIDALYPYQEKGYLFGGETPYTLKNFL